MSIMRLLKHPRELLWAGIWVAVFEVLGASGSVFVTDAIPTWYATLAKPFFSPPNWVFAPVWGILYALMALAAYIVYTHRNVFGRDQALAAFATQLVLNIAWTPVFFGLRNPVLGLVVIIALLPMIVVTIVRFASVSRTAAWMLLPYVTWVAFATVLNIAIVFLN